MPKKVEIFLELPGNSESHENLFGRNNPNQHSIGAITGLEETLQYLKDSLDEKLSADIQYAKSIDFHNNLLRLYDQNGNLLDTTIIVTTNETFIYEQGVASQTWNINHNKGKYPSVTIVDSAGTVVEGDIVYTDENNCVIYFNAGFVGKAYLN